jgi:hypothetical protein
MIRNLEVIRIESQPARQALRRLDRVKLNGWRRAQQNFIHVSGVYSCRPMYSTVTTVLSCRFPLFCFILVSGPKYRLAVQ